MKSLLIYVGVLAIFFPIKVSVASDPGEEAFLQLVEDAAGNIVIPLWPEGEKSVDKSAAAELVETPDSGGVRIRNVTHPSITILPPPPGATRSGVILLFAPGGGYGTLSLPNAVDISRWAKVLGVHCAMLKYRVPRDKADAGHHIPLADAQRAVRLLRARAGELGIEPQKIIMVGSSAGGHLACNLANNYDAQTYPAGDEADELSARPNGVLLMYPAYLTDPIESLTADQHLQLDLLSPQRTPPIFMAVTAPDKFVWGALNTMLMLRQAKVPAELHIYPTGGHGGCFDKYPLMEFVRPASRFLMEQGLFTDAMCRASEQWLDSHEAGFLDRENESKVLKTTRARISGVPLSDWSSADHKLAELNPSPSVLRLWTGEGTHPHDPLPKIDEALPDRGDGKVRVMDVTVPTMHVWQPEIPDGRAMLVFPGGGYNGLAAQHEGTEIAAWLNRQGITAFVVKYRVPRRTGLEKHVVALQDAQRAIRVVRNRALEFGIDPSQIGVLGFSAGGNLAALTVHQAENSSYEVMDAVDSVSAKPNFAVLIYPAYLVKEGNETELDSLIVPLQSRNDYPPTYVAVAADDRFAPDSICYALHRHQQKAPSELHVFSSGGHGNGLRAEGGPFAQWPQSCERWLSDLKHGTTEIHLDDSRRQAVR